ncbi:MAG: hypothetical protein WC942_10490 [Clostridia bacterium]|jgi:hypothetical protein
MTSKTNKNNPQESPPPFCTLFNRTDILVDWLQIYGHHVEFTSPLFDFRIKPFGTKHFNYVTEVWEGTNKIGEIAHSPRSRILHKDSVIIKLDNKVLYLSNLEYIINKLVSALCFEIRSITRVDFAVDFPTFLNGLHPNNFISKFLQNDILKIGRGTFKVVGCQKKINEYDYLRFGSNTSDVSAYVYNKTKELNQVKNKPYIRENWTWYDNKQDSWQSFDTWRLEFSIKNDKITYLNIDTGELVPLTINTILCLETRRFIFHSLLNHYFYFVHNSGQSRKDRMRKVATLNIMDTPGQLLIPNEHTESGRMQKIFIRMLEEFNNENRKLSKEYESAGSLLIEKYIEKYDLKGWVNKNQILNFNKS